MSICEEVVLTVDEPINYYSHIFYWDILGMDRVNQEQVNIIYLN